ncbi:mycofactocin-coupled SDR family oxidoreductase [uncultured Modestobacter sp.]|uniref:mycofactocin-coupled SDR family oxidoreductase n=1 Tax=uncultured Modestobacter sp. TaxID=380048 RepID=UPI002623069F|nr:mycofactocin-coupled SDR family oxidoreductase [uncultured Modestobacter sp.]
MGKLDGKVAFVTGAARGQGRSHAVHLAREGADIIAVDQCAPVGTVPYDLATPDDLAQTATEVEALDRRIITTQADVRDGAAMKQAVDDGVAQLGRLDIVVANAGILSFSTAEEMSDEMWDDMIATNLSGQFKAVRPAIPHLKANDDGGAIVITSSTAGLKAVQNLAHYTAAKHGVVGLVKVLALELAPDKIRVNSVHPTNVNTDMIQNQSTYSNFRPDLDNPGKDEVQDTFASLNALPIPWVESADVSEAVLYLVSDSGRYVTGIQLPVDAGMLTK